MVFVKTVRTDALLGFKELEERTQIPGSTIRRYVERFSKFLPGRTVDRVKRFSPDLVEIFRRIHGLYQEGKRTEEVAGILAIEFGATYEIPTVSTDATTIAMPPAVTDTLACLTPILERLTVALERIAENSGRTAAMVEARLARLEAQNVQSGDVLRVGPGNEQNEEQKPQKRASTAVRMTREEIVGRVMELRATGMGAGAITTRLRREDVPTLSGRGQWGKGTVRRILRIGGEES